MRCYANANGKTEDEKERRGKEKFDYFLTLTVSNRNDCNATTISKLDAYSPKTARFGKHKLG